MPRAGHANARDSRTRRPRAGTMARQRAVRMSRAGGRRPEAARARVRVPTAGGLVRRPRLHDLLDASLAAPVIIVAAAAGWGKTVLLSSWVEAGAERRVAWLNLETIHDAPQPFWRAVAVALRDTVGGQTTQTLQEVVAGGVATEYLPSAVADAVRSARNPVVLVLDSLHEITSSEVHHGLLRLVERPVAGLSIVVATRRDPPWPLQRLRVAGLVRDVRAVDLAFRHDEAAELFELLGLELTSGQVERLRDRTEGWAAGLRLAALHLQDRADLDAAVAAFSGDDHAVAGYLLTEVLDQQAPELITFLTAVSVVDLVCADLARVLTDRSDAGQVLADLAGAHLFVREVDRPGRWFRLHRLVLDILRARSLPSRRRRDLHRRAAEWFRGNGMPFEAIRSSVTAGLWRLAADLTGVHALALVMGGDGPQLERVLDQVPATVVGSHPELAAGLAGARVAQGNGADVPRLLEAARMVRTDGLPSRRRDRAEVLRLMSAGGFGRLAGDWGAVRDAYQQVPLEPDALAALGMAGGEIVPVVVHNNLGTAALWTGDLGAAERHLTAAVEAVVPGVVLAQLNAASYRALLQAERGELDSAESEAHKVLATAAAAGMEDTAQVAAAHLALIEVALGRGDLEAADERSAHLPAFENLTAEPHVRLVVALLVAERLALAGKHEPALANLRAQLDAEADRAPPVLLERARLLEASLLARTGDPERTLAVLDGLGTPATPGALLSAAGLRLRLGDHRIATELRRRVVDPSPVRLRVQVGILDALLAGAVADEARARDRLEDALVTALPCGLRGPFLVEGTEVRPILQACLERGTATPEFALDLLGRMVASPQEAGGVSALVEPPTERERTVLQYLSSSLSNAEIAAELYVSVSTVKTHERALYRKLGATGRRDAVRRARLLGLL
ncbi:LuxR C-terminal-related transcriptional regulator [Pseudonocardia sp. RS11V-5]|uniref:LuxR C-terminal-related transcriptional regulator n=1 Tax=Pseudonocardia terrae TaxID=2905831 RepID=UPI001E56B0FA|nr:LuxR C-terminal-related transcriptional regulator [Pseudonocardia terrae]MCE3555456.1 LuxR C-terminal-related transcriptional regulator [Pseudonocardia terrae]